METRFYDDGLYLAHHGILGQKWGVRRFQNYDGTRIDKAGAKVEKKKYKKELKSDRKIRSSMELKAYDSAIFNKQYKDAAKAAEKRYQKAIAKDPDKLKEKTNRKERDRDAAAYQAKVYNEYHEQNMKELRDHVSSMVDKYSNTKIKDVRTMTRFGNEYLKSTSAAVANFNSVYSLRAIESIDNDYRKTTYRKPAKSRIYVY